MKRKKSIMKIASAMFALAFAMVFALAGSVNVFANADELTAGGYTYKGTGYVTTEWTSGTELVAKIDTYYYQNLRDEEFAGEDVYFYKRDSAGNRVSADVYGYAYTEFTTSKASYATTKTKYGYNNVTVVPENGCSMWYQATPRYYGCATKEK
ncbi:MAG: hypothetical protein HFH91_15005 [Lachnospiraceae bacterium]|nr:hypothetical protein [Lachnospiraceae bacterium]